MWRRDVMHAENQRRFDSVEDRLKDLEETMHGNGQPGLKVRMDRQEQRLSIIYYVVWALLVGAIPTVWNAIGQLVASHFVK